MKLNKWIKLLAIGLVVLTISCSGCVGTQPKLDSEPEPFKINGLYIGQDYAQAQIIVKNELTSGAGYEIHPMKLRMWLMQFVKGYDQLYGYKTNAFVYNGWNLAAVGMDNRVHMIFLGGRDGHLNFPELIPKKDRLNFDQFVANFMNEYKITELPKRGYLHPILDQQAYFDYGDVVVFLAENQNIMVLKKTPELMDAIKDEPVNNIRPKPKHNQV